MFCNQDAVWGGGVEEGGRGGVETRFLFVICRRAYTVHKSLHTMYLALPCTFDIPYNKYFTQ